MIRPTIIDAKGLPLSLGDLIDGGDCIGKLVEFREPDESHWKVAVEWPGWPGDPEVFETSGPTVYMDDLSPHRCADIERAS